MPKSPGRLSVVAFIADVVVVKKIPAHLGLNNPPPSKPSAVTRLALFADPIARGAADPASSRPSAPTREQIPLKTRHYTLDLAIGPDCVSVSRPAYLGGRQDVFEVLAFSRCHGRHRIL